MPEGPVCPRPRPVSPPASRSARFSGRACLAGLLFAFAGFSAARPAAAFERQWHAGAGLGLRPTSIDGLNGGAVAPLVALNLTYGLTDQFDAFAEVGLARPVFTIPGLEGDHALLTTTGDLGVVYTLDVLRVVPYLGLMAGVHHVGSATVLVPGAGEGKLGGATGLDLGAAGGVRYQYDRTLAFGFDLRFHRPIRLPETTQAMGMFVSAAYTWGY
jgi:hypothetical protein